MDTTPVIETQTPGLRIVAQSPIRIFGGAKYLISIQGTGVLGKGKTITERFKVPDYISECILSDQYTVKSLVPGEHSITKYDDETGTLVLVIGYAPSHDLKVQDTINIFELHFED